VVITMIIIPIIGVQPLPARGADDHHRPVIVGAGSGVTVGSRSAPRRVLLCAANATNSAAAFFQTGAAALFVARLLSRLGDAM